MKITRKGKTCKTIIDISTVPVGAVFDATLMDYKGPFLRTFGEIVSLSDPRTTWTSKFPPFSDIVLLDVELVVKGTL